MKERSSEFLSCKLESLLLIPERSDVVDTEHAYGDTYKMILGSFVEEYDFSEIQVTWPGTPAAQSPSSMPSWR